jgi:hypothetical protein
MTKKELKERGDALVNRVEDLTKEVFRGERLLSQVSVFLDRVEYPCVLDTPESLRQWAASLRRELRSVRLRR